METVGGGGMNGNNREDDGGKGGGRVKGLGFPGGGGILGSGGVQNPYIYNTGINSKYPHYYVIISFVEKRQVSRIN